MKRKIVAELVLSPRSNAIGISKPLKETLKILKKKKYLKLELHSMGTNIECDDLDLLFEAIKECHNYLIKNFPRVVTTIKIDERTDKESHTIKSKIQAVSEK